MTKPFIFCHMLTSIDGKITGSYMDTPEAKIAGELFYELAFGEKAFYKNQGWLSGRKTTDDNFTFYEKPTVPTTFDEIPKGDYIAEVGKPIYYISVDPSGKLGWKKNTITYRDTEATVIEVLTEKATDEYKAFLRNLKIPYIIAGKKIVDSNVTVEKLAKEFNLESIMLGGGGLLNWSFIEAGVCDELSLVIAPVADGSSENPSVFESGELSKNEATVFSFEQIDIQNNGTIWIRYKVNK